MTSFIVRVLGQNLLKLVLLVLFSLSFLGFSCGEPCRNLADYICSCKQTSAEREICSKNLDMKLSHPDFDMANDENVCVELLKPDSGCDCQAILNNDYAKCGMTRKPN